jgi:hypothetical protein
VGRKSDGPSSFESRIPRRIDVAAAYYGGIGELEEGRYPEALSFFLEGSELGKDFLPVHRAAIRAYYLCGENEHAVLQAGSLGSRMAAEGRLRQSLEFTFAAAEHASLGENAGAAAILLLEQMVARARRHEQETRELERALSNEQARSELARKLCWGMGEESWWRLLRTPSRPGVVHEESDPEVYQWGVRAQRDLARAYASAGRLDDSLSGYRSILETLEPLRAEDDALRRSSEAIRAEAHFLWLWHFSRTGKLHRDHALRGANALNLVEEGVAFVRDFSAPGPDPRARVASSLEDRGHEFFDYACAEGFQIDSVSWVGEIDGFARCSFHLPDPQGWPPRYSFSRRIHEMRWKDPGTYRETLRLPPGTQFLSIGTGWGPDPFSDSAVDLLRRRALDLPAHRDIRRWSAVFELSPLAAGGSPGGPSQPGAPSHSREADKRLVTHHAGRDGWEVGSVLRPSTARRLKGFPSPCHEEDWRVSALDGDLFLHHRDLALAIDLPSTINTPARELDPCLVRTHAGSWALLFSRGEERDLQHLVASTADGVRWEAPLSLRFDPPPQPPARDARSLEGSSGVRRTEAGYVMLLQNGFARRSEDLRTWSEPVALFEGEIWRTCLTESDEGVLWAACVAGPDELVPYRADTPMGDALAGYFVVDGVRYKHVCELRVAASLDGIEWTERGRILLSGQAGGLWALAVPGAEIAVALQFNGRFLKWFLSSPRGLEEAPSPVELLCTAEGVAFYAREGSIWCLRPVLDAYEGQRNAVLRMGSGSLFERLVR